MPKCLQVDVTERRAFVIRLRVAGASLDQCAKEAYRKFGQERMPAKYDERAVWQDIQRAQKRIYSDLRHEINAFRMIQLDRYESIIRAHWPKAISGKALGCLDRVLQAMRDENRLLGLSASQKLDVRVVKIDARIEELMEAMATQRQNEAAGSLGAGGDPEDDSIVEGTARHL